MSDRTGGLSYLDYLDGRGTPEQRALFEMIEGSIDPKRMSRVPRSRRYLVIRWIVRGLVKIAIVLLVLYAIQWFLILLWAGFGS